MPKEISFETLEFIEEVKTTRPIPWIKPFENVTEIKQEIQKKMLNELAELFLFRNKHLQAVVRAFSTVLDDLPEDKRKETLSKIGATKELIDKIEGQTNEILNFKKEKDKLQSQLTKKTEELEKAQKEKKKETATLQKKVNSLTEELNKIDTKIYSHELNNANYLLSGSPTGVTGYDSFSGFQSPVSGIELNSDLYTVGPQGAVYSLNYKCDKCGKIFAPALHMMTENELKTCPICNRTLCQECFNGLDDSNALHLSCEDCRKYN